VRAARLLLLELVRVYVIVGACIGITTYRVTAMCGVPDAGYAIWLAATWPWWIRGAT
jgi:hypothetical protein